MSCCHNKNLQLNASEIRDMIVDFRKRKTTLAPLIIKNESIEMVDCFKCLDTIISNTVSHILDIFKSRFGAVTGSYEDVTGSFFCKTESSETLH